MTRHTTFQYTAAPTAEQQRALLRHVGAARFAYNQGLRMHLEARQRRREDELVHVPWSGFDLVNAFNRWKLSEEAGRVIAVAGDGMAEVEATGLSWRQEVSAQVFEEAAIDLGRALQAWVASRSGKRRGRAVHHPRFRRRNVGHGSFGPVVLVIQDMLGVRARRTGSGARRPGVRV